MTLSFSVFFINYYLSQHLDITEFGQFSLIYGAIGIASSFVMLGQATAITSAYFSDEKKDANNIHYELLHSYQLILWSFLGFCLVVTLGWSLYYNKIYPLIYVVLFCTSILLYTFQVFFISFLTLLDAYKKYFLLAFLVSFFLIINIILNPTLFGFFYGMILSGFISILFGINTHFYHKKNQQYAEIIFSKKTLFSFGWIAIPGMLVSSLNAYLDRYIVEYYFDLKQVAYYSLAATVSIGIGMVFVNALIKGSIISMLQALQDKKAELFLHTQKNIENIFIFVSIVVFIAYYSIGDTCILYIFGEKYEKSLPFMLPLFFYALINGLGQLYGQPLVQKKKLYILLYISIFTVCLNIFFSLLFINMLGIKGIVVSLLLTATNSLTLIYYYSKMNANFLKFPIKAFIVIFILSVWSIYYA